MGRKKIYNSKEEKHEAELRWKREWYRRNSDKVKQYRMSKYWKNLGEKLPKVQQNSKV